MKSLPFAAAFIAAVSFAPAHALTLADARARALAANPGVRAAQARVDAAKARRGEAGRLANPVLSAEVENFGPTASRLESTIKLGQTLALGGDGGSRAALAEAQVQSLEAEVLIVRREVVLSTDELFLDAWAVQARLHALAQAETLAAEAVRAADARHLAGAALASERVRAEAQLALRALERARAEADFTSKQAQLAALLGEPLDEALDPSARTPIDEDPRLARARAEVAIEEARRREAGALRAPDLDVEFGVRHLRETGTTGFVAGLALPLPLWNSQSGSVQAAEAEIVSAQARVDQVERTLDAERRAARARQDAARLTLDRLTTLSPAAAKAHEQVRTAYRAGRLGYNDLLEAQRAVSETELAAIEAAIERTRAEVALEHLEAR